MLFWLCFLFLCFWQDRKTKMENKKNLVFFCCCFFKCKNSNERERECCFFFGFLWMKKKEKLFLCFFFCYMWIFFFPYKKRRKNTIVTWLILPVAICSLQRLSHACLSINNFILWNCRWLIKSVIIYLMVFFFTTWITVVNLELIHA